ncbi:Dedicator Of Cytokinesis Protein 7 [Manis pentadactyla]|nr:Dedicator Of Cytokinesis Protein 7 [Manis pentadactyla]
MNSRAPSSTRSQTPQFLRFLGLRSGVGRRLSPWRLGGDRHRPGDLSREESGCRSGSTPVWSAAAIALMPAASLRLSPGSWHSLLPYKTGLLTLPHKMAHKREI